jgi:hypothetical protein
MINDDELVSVVSGNYEPDTQSKKNTQTVDSTFEKVDSTKLTIQTRELCSCNLTKIGRILPGVLIP